jgi:hypothetical protein
MAARRGSLSDSGSWTRRPGAAGALGRLAQCQCGPAVQTSGHQPPQPLSGPGAGRGPPPGAPRRGPARAGAGPPVGFQQTGDGVSPPSTGRPADKSDGDGFRAQFPPGDASDCADRDVRFLASAAPPGRPRPRLTRGAATWTPLFTTPGVTLATHRARSQPGALPRCTHRS